MVPLAFAATLALLFGGLLIILLSPSTPGNVYTKHLPQTIPSYAGPIGRYAPADSLQVSLVNVTAVGAINGSILSNSPFLSFSDPKFRINNSDIGVRISIALNSPNATVSIAMLNAGAYRVVSLAFNSSSLPQSRVGNYILYNVAETSSGTPTPTWVTMSALDDSFLSSEGALPALDAIKTVLNVAEGSAPSILTRDDIREMLYTVNGTSNHLGLGVQNFPGAVQTAKMTLVSIDRTTSSTLTVNYVVNFADPTQAQSQIPYVMRVYLGAERFTTYDQLVQATAVQPLAALAKVIVLVG